MVLQLSGRFKRCREKRLRTFYMPPERITRYSYVARDVYAFFDMSLGVYLRASSGKNLRVKKLLFGKFKVIVPLL